MTVGYSKSKTHRNGNHRSLNDKPITIYGDVQRARYVLYVEDLAENFLPVQKDISAISGQVFNIGGGPANTTSLLELLKLISDLRGGAPEVRFDAWRPADQRYHVSNMCALPEPAGEFARVSLREDVRESARQTSPTESELEPGHENPAY